MLSVTFHDVPILTFQAAQRNAKYGKALPYNLQNLYFFIGKSSFSSFIDFSMFSLYFSRTTSVPSLFSIHDDTTCNQTK